MFFGEKSTDYGFDGYDIELDDALLQQAIEEKNDTVMEV